MSSKVSESGHSSSNKAAATSIKYPPISNWLESLDKHTERGQDGLNYAQYASPLKANGIIRLDDLIAIRTPEKLQDLAGMNWGTANRLIRFAEQDRDEGFLVGEKMDTT